MRKRSRDAQAPDITPMIDVVFLLLIFFMVSTVFKKEELALLLNLPKTDQEEESSSKNDKTVTVELTNNQIAVNGKKYSLEELDGVFSAIKKKTIPVELRSDKDVRYERLVKVLDKLKKNDLTNLSLITEN